MYLFLGLSVGDRPLLLLSVLQQLLEGDQVGLEELQFGGEQLSRLLLGSHSSQFMLLLLLQVSDLTERRQARHLLLDLLEHLLYTNTDTESLTQPGTLVCSLLYTAGEFLSSISTSGC